MDDAELIGGVLVDTADPREAARHLAELLVAPAADRTAASRAGLDPDLVDVLHARLGRNREHVAAACQEGAAWVLGRRSVSMNEPWELVASLPGGATLPQGLRRTTGETLIQLVTRATRTLRLAAPFLDHTGLSFVADALAAGTSRGARVEILLPTRSTHADDALQQLQATIRRDGTAANFRISRLRFDAPWAHLKVLTSDSTIAYIGSANVTGAGLTGNNLELGVLVHGPAVTTVEELLDLYRED